MREAVAFLFLASLVSGLRYGLQSSFRDPLTYYKPHKGLDATANGKSAYSWVEEWIDVPVDHFAYIDERTFELRYFINLTYYQPGGPIFFYTGNEGWLEAFAENTGFMWDIAPEYKAALVFVEHRYYGKSLPFGNKSFTSVENLGYLSAEQALADFADAVYHLKKERIPDATHSPVISFGGSYGGMLAAWFRIKYPHLTDGAIAASAPVFWFQNTGVSEGGYAEVTTRTFKISGCSLKKLQASFDAVKKLAKSESGREFLNKAFHLDKDSQFEHSHDAYYFINVISDIMGNVVMVDYPYATNFIKNVPAWPVKEICKSFPDTAIKDPKTEAVALYSVLNIFLNNTGDVKEFCLRGPNCGDDDQLGAMDGWTWQTCTEMIMPICNDGPPNDVFEKTCPFALTAWFEYCHKAYGKIGFKHSLFRPHWIIENFGAEYPTASNIVFSNGYLDPWSAGGWRLEPATEGTLVSLIVEDGAHHYDLRGAHPDDTDRVKEVRTIEKQHITRWIKQAKETPSRQFKRVRGGQSADGAHGHHRLHHHIRHHH